MNHCNQIDYKLLIKKLVKNIEALYLARTICYNKFYKLFPFVYLENYFDIYYSFYYNSVCNVSDYLSASTLHCVSIGSDSFRTIIWEYARRTATTYKVFLQN